MTTQAEWDRWARSREKFLARSTSPPYIELYSEQNAYMLDHMLVALGCTACQDSSFSGEREFWLAGEETVYYVYRQRRSIGKPFLVDPLTELPKKWSVSTVGNHTIVPNIVDLDKGTTVTGDELPYNKEIDTKAPTYRRSRSHFFLRIDKAICYPNGEYVKATNYCTYTKPLGEREYSWFSWGSYYNLPHPMAKFEPRVDGTQRTIIQERAHAMLSAVAADSPMAKADPIPFDDIEDIHMDARFICQDILCIAAWAAIHMWHVKFWMDNAPAVVIPSSPAGIRLIIQLRDVPEGRTRRQAIGHWVSQHYRENSYNREEEIKVREHLRSINTTFRWFGMNCQVCPSQIDLERNHQLAIERANDPDTRRPRTPRERAEERRRRRR